MPSHLSLSELQSQIKRGIDQFHPLSYWVTAEISEMKVNSNSGHCYLELVEKGGANHIPKAKVNAVIWRNAYGMLSSYFEAATREKLETGLKILVKVHVTYHELYGLSLQITDIDPTYTLGDMERQRQQTILRLQQEGVFDMNRELPLPDIIQHIAVISSRQAAGFQDFMEEIEGSPYRFRVTLFDAFMQGAGAEESIIEALGGVADRQEAFDALVLIRGGGAQSDLGCFNSYRLCCYLTQFPLPVIVGIGHDKDQSVADLVSALSLKTPTAVAVYLKNRMMQFDTRLDLLRSELADSAEGLLRGQQLQLREAAFRLSRAPVRQLREAGLHVTHLSGSVCHGAGELIRRQNDHLSVLRDRLLRTSRITLSNGEVRLDNLVEMLSHRSREYLMFQTKKLSLLGELVDTHDPQHILKMGFALLRCGKHAVTDTTPLHQGDTIEIVTHCRTIEAKINKIK